MIADDRGPGSASVSSHPRRTRRTRLLIATTNRDKLREIHTVKEWLDLKDLNLSAQMVLEVVRLNANL